MRRVRVEALRPGMRLGMPVYGSRGLLLREGVELGPAHIEHLRRARLDAVYVDDPLFADVPVPADVSWEVKSAFLSAAAALWEHFRGLAPREGAHSGIPDVGAVRWPVPYGHLMDVASGLETELRQVPAWAVQMVGGGEEDGAVAHAVNTALVAASLARHAGLGGYVRELAVAGLLHDMGLALLPERLHLEPEDAAGEEQALLWAHPLLGVKLMRSQPASAFVQAAVAQHHERFDGSGYPQRLSGSRLAPHAGLLALADTFVRLTGAGAGRSEAWEYVVSGAGSEFDHRLVQAFSQAIPPYPLGSTVRLSTGEVGVVVGLNPATLTRPCLRLLRDAYGRPLEQAVTYDLAEAAHRNRVIVGEASDA